MKATSISRLLFAFLLSLFLGTSTNLFAVTKEDTQFHSMIDETQTHIAQMDNDVDKLAAHLRSFGNTPWESQSDTLSQIKAQLNILGQMVPKAQDMVDAHGWQKEWIDRFSGVTKAMVEETEAAIELLNKHQNTTRLYLDKDYRAHISALQQLSDELVTLRDFADAHQGVDFIANPDNAINYYRG